MLRLNRTGPDRGPSRGTRHPRQRSGAILLVVLALLALFAVVGLSFLLYAESEANAARIHRDTVATKVDAPPDPTGVVNAIFGQMLFPATTVEGKRSAFHGHDFSTLMYGGQGGVTPYNGVGTVSVQLDPTRLPPLFTAAGLAAYDRKDAINYTPWDGPYGVANYTTWVEPETVNLVNNPSYTGLGVLQSGSALSVVNPVAAPAGTTAVYVPKNAPYTYPDRNNALLAAMDPRTGHVTAVSGHRDGLFNDAGVTGLAANNPNWYNVAGRFKTLRPRPFDHLTAADRSALATANPGLAAIFNNPTAVVTPAQANQLALLAQAGQLGDFPFPVVNPDGTVTGDVQNLTYSTANTANTATSPAAVGAGQQRMDAVWMYPNLPVFQYKNRTVAVMVAPTVVPLDGRVNVNVAGNLVAGSTTHRSHSGFGPHEINLGKVLEPVGGMTAATYAQQIIVKRYGTTAAAATVPVPRAYPSGADATFLSTATTTTPPTQAGEHYPTRPNPVAVYAPKAFHPLSPPAGVRFTTSPRSALVINQQRPPESMAVNWSGEASAYRLPGIDTAVGRYRTGPKLSYLNSQFTGTDPDATMAPGSDAPNATNSDTMYHPLTWNPYSRDPFAVATPASTFGLFPLGDIRATGGKYADRNARLTSETVLARDDGGYTGSTQFGRDLPVLAHHGARNRTTPISNSRPAGGLPVNFVGDPNVKLKLFAGQQVPQLQTGAATPTQASPQFSLRQLAAPITQMGLNDVTYTGASDATDSGTPTNADLSSKRARLGPIDLNRPLPDYRNDLTTPLGTGNLGNEAAARPARQQLATDIFVRLAVATGASVRWNGAQVVTPKWSVANSRYEFLATELPGLPAAAAGVTTEEYDALRWLAQYAANVVDALDSDDISTTFVWNPTTATNPEEAANFDDSTAEGTTGRTALKNRVVYGVEKPRIVLNEVYAELTNDDTESMASRAQRPFQARFFAELLNPSSRDATSPQPQEVPLESYKVVVYDQSDAVRGELLTGPQVAANVRGAIPDATVSKIEARMTNLAVGQESYNDDGTAVRTDSRLALEPNNGQYAPDVTAAAPRRFGFGLVGPGKADGSGLPPGDTEAFTPDMADLKFKMMLQKPIDAPPAGAVAGFTNKDQMVYFIEPKTDAELLPIKTQFETLTRHAVLLQRPANPYLAWNAVTNPYLTVDAVYDVRLHDAVRVINVPAGNGTRTVSNADPKQNRSAIGRTQPFAGAMPASPHTGTPSKTTTLTLKQRPNAPGTDMNVRHTLQQHNGDEGFNPTSPSSPGDATLDFPFEWYTHLDRRVINGEELLHVAAVKPHEVTYQFARPNPSYPIEKTVGHLHAMGRWVDPAANTGGGPRDTAETTLVERSPFYRALDFLMPKPWGHDLPLAGRVPGRININLVQDKKVFMALLDQNSGSSFTGPDTLPTAPPLADQDIERMWTDFQQSRSPRFPRVGNTSDESNLPEVDGLPQDRPFKGFGAPRFDTLGFGTPTGSNLVGDPVTGVRGREDTLLRSVADGVNRRLLFSRPGQTTRFTDAADPTHPYRDNEALRKILNNVTTTSDTFLVVFTVGYFEVRAGDQLDPVNNPIVLGKEVYNNTPGDLRAKFAAVVDRTHLAREAPAADPTTGAASVPWVMESQSEVANLSTAAPNDIKEVLISLPAAVDQTGWDGGNPDMIPAGQIANAELHYNVNKPVGGAPLSHEYFITPRHNRYNTVARPVIPDSDTANNPYRELVLTGRYEGRDFTIASRYVAGAGARTLPGTVFYIGTGRKRTRVSAYYHPPTGRQWSYNPITGQARIFVQVLPTEPPEDGFGQTYAPGTILSSVVFGTPTAPAVDVRTATPVVPFFTRLTP